MRTGFYVYALVDGQIPRYVGYTERPDRRRRVHASAHPSWLWLVLSAYGSRADGLDGERWWIKRLWERGYPLINADLGGGASRPGLIPSVLTRARMALAKQGRKLTMIHRKHIGMAHRGLKRREGTGERIAQAKRGHPCSAATKAKISAALKDKHLTSETRARMAVSQQRRRAKEKSC